MPTTIQQFNFSVNLLRAILWQYNNAQKTQALLQSKQAWYDANQTLFWDNWITDVFDLRTANDFGLVVWAIILGFPLAYITGSVSGAPPFGFGSETATPNTNQNFYNSNFGSNSSVVISLTRDQKRLLLQLRYRQLTSRGTIPEINNILTTLLGQYGRMYALDGLNMTITIVCKFTIPSFLSFLFSNFDLLPRPAGVKLLVISSAEPLFGFGSETSTPNSNQNFNNGAFSPS